MLPPLTEILGGKTVSAFNSIVNQTNGGDRAPRVQTLEVDPLVSLILFKFIYLQNLYIL